MKHKIFKRIVTFTLSILTMTLILPKDIEVNAATAQTSIKPVFGSSFIQYWYAEDWDQSRWLKEFSMLQNIGIGEIILQNVADTKASYAAYSTNLPGYSHNDIDMLNNALTAADQTGMHVRIGLGFNGDWWNNSTSNMDWLRNEATLNKAIFNEILQNYGTHPSLTGWYIPYEFSQFTAYSPATRANLNSFLKQITGEIKLKDTRNIMIAPFYNGEYSFMFSFPWWTSTLQSVLKDTNIDIVALQDSVGAGLNTLKQLPQVFASTKIATDSLGMTLYADTETFVSTPGGNVSASQNKISNRLSIEKDYVEGFVAFSIDHYQNKNNASQVKNYNDYYEYYLANK